MPSHCNARILPVPSSVVKDGKVIFARATFIDVRTYTRDRDARCSVPLNLQLLPGRGHATPSRNSIWKGV